MKKHNKVLLVVLCAALLVVGSVAGTLAWLTSQETVVNTFTIGKVTIDLDEAKVDTNGNVVTPEERVKANTYHLLPGHEYHKDPTVTVLAGSDETYVRMLVTVEDLDDLKLALPDYVAADGVFLLQDVVSGWESSEWAFAGIEGNVYEFRYVGETYKGSKYGTVKKAEADIELPALFDTIILPGEIDSNDLDSLAQLKITVVAQAIQAAGFENEAKAWEAFDIQHP